MYAPGPHQKIKVAELINTWSQRSGLRKQQIAARAGFFGYHDFYRAYLDLSRNLSLDAHAAIRVVRACTEGLPADERCTTDEAVQFFILTHLPLDRYRELAEQHVFPADAWQVSVARHVAGNTVEPPDTALARHTPCRWGDPNARALTATVHHLRRGPPRRRLRSLPTRVTYRQHTPPRCPLRRRGHYDNGYDCRCPTRERFS